MRFNYTYFLLTFAFIIFNAPQITAQDTGQGRERTYKLFVDMTLMIKPDGTAEYYSFSWNEAILDGICGGPKKQRPSSVEGAKVYEQSELDSSGHCIGKHEIYLENLSALNGILAKQDTGSLQVDGNRISLRYSLSIPSQFIGLWKVRVIMPSITDYKPQHGTVKRLDNEQQVSWDFTPQNVEFEVTGQLVGEVDECDYSRDSEKASAWDIELALAVIKTNASYIQEAAKKFSVEPRVLAGAIFAEQARNFSLSKAMFEPLVAAHLPLPGWPNRKSISLGVGQVQMFNAEKVEAAGLMPPQPNSKARIAALQDSRTNILYAAAYIKYLEGRFPNARGNDGTLINLFNIGERRKDGTPVTVSNPPKYNCFAAEAVRQFNAINTALGHN